jgi:DNA-binding protein HU-beta
MDYFHYPNEKEKWHMKKSEVIDEVAKVLKSKKEARAAVDSLLSNILKALKKKEDVTLTGFGKFKAVKRKARNGRNPYTGEPIKIKASTGVKFVPGKALKDAVS